MRTLEDPVVWFSGGLYHIVVNDWSTRKAYHITSVDGLPTGGVHSVQNRSELGWRPTRGGRPESESDTPVI